MRKHIICSIAKRWEIWHLYRNSLVMFLTFSDPPLQSRVFSANFYVCCWRCCVVNDINVRKQSIARRFSTQSVFTHWILERLYWSSQLQSTLSSSFQLQAQRITPHGSTHRSCRHASLCWPILGLAGKARPRQLELEPPSHQLSVEEHLWSAK